MNARALTIALVACALCGGCATSPTAKPTTQALPGGVTAAVTDTAAAGTQEPMSTSNSTATIESRGNNQWLVRVTRTCTGATLAGEIVVKAATQPSPTAAPHAGLAGSMAYLALGKSKLAAGDARAAIDCVSAGLADLGNDYAAPTAMDDTSLKLLVARERVDENYLADGAAVMLRVLEIRINLYRQLHAGELAQ